MANGYRKGEPAAELRQKAVTGQDHQLKQVTVQSSTPSPASADAALASRDQLVHRDQKVMPEPMVRTVLLVVLAKPAKTAEQIPHLERNQSHALSVLQALLVLAE